jgi:hypothetical protein
VPKPRPRASLTARLAAPARGVAASLAAIGWIVSCGARTGLDLPSDLVLTGTDGGLDGGDAADGADAAPVGCTPGTVNLTKATPTVMFILDRSGSMGDQLGRTVGATRWDILTNALASTLPPVDSTMGIGALLFPTAGPGAAQSCSAPGTADLPPRTGNVNTLIALMHADQPNGGTPTADAIDAAAKYLLGVRAATSARAMVLATDGEPNCNTNLNANTCTCVESTRGCQGRPNQCLDDTRTVARLASYDAQGLPTYVIGLQDQGNAGFVSVLDAMAIAGGRAQTGAAHQYYSANSEAELDSALVTIRDQVGACTFLTSSVPDASGTILVTVNGVPIPYDASRTNGWAWANQPNGEMAFYGTACVAAVAAGTHALDAVVTCGDAAAPPDATVVDAGTRRDAAGIGDARGD